jgi:NAD(P)-dependent dehydrogenase (short-subunit alcohol dehydrogenase family)
MPSRFENKVLLISGASGIAAATARLAMAEGASVIAVARHSGELEDVVLGDLTEPATARKAVQHCVDRYGRVDCLYNVAGMSARSLGDGPLHTCSDEAWDQTMETNVKTMFLLTRETLQVMLEQPVAANGLRGVILNMASVAATIPETHHFNTFAYAVSKGAAITMTKVAAAYYAPHRIRVNAIAPAVTRTPLTKRSQENCETLDYLQHRQPLAGGMIDADDIARASLFLLSDDSRMITGETLVVDAGWGLST